MVRQSGLSTSVHWQVSEQAFALIYNYYPKDLVAAYVRRWGSITPADIDTSIDKCAVNEIRWRFIRVKQNFRWRIEKEHPEGQVWYEQTYLVYDGKSRRYSLKGPDLYDPETPPQPPTELNSLSPRPEVPEKSEKP